MYFNIQACWFSWMRSFLALCLFFYESNFVPAHLTASAARNLVKHKNRRLSCIKDVTIWMKGMPAVLNKRDRPIFEGSTAVNLSIFLFLFRSIQVYGGSNFLLKIAIVDQGKGYRDKEDNRWIVGGEDSPALICSKRHYPTACHHCREQFISIFGERTDDIFFVFHSNFCTKFFWQKQCEINFSNLKEREGVTFSTLKKSNVQFFLAAPPRQFKCRDLLFFVLILVSIFFVFV